LPMLLHHYSDNKISEIITKGQSSEKKHYTRPIGLWVSVVGDDDWKSLSIGDLRSQNQYEITLADEARILFLNGEEQLLEFTQAFGLKPSGEQRIAIDWVQVAIMYHGLIIAPYRAELTESDALFWWGAWGCASGCIWNKDAISEIKLIREGEPLWWINENPPFPPL
jgi:hypothetical protein